ncbi:cytochrome c biogenesis CcdA family protein [Thermomicrobium sp. 4228-Ro]|uniref:cytochrome c biogenesis CcdA family protein n=1 Tax=Thermomicrobium sp. 4228-Ro TaxID=2993937 RepID=UPI0022489D6F|nr:cytochrome c biogenesis CcdA family protein [Thermomicrobium sp. 4228-Ro]MCX2726688.1 cytochrome c biogenesis CcdA family protein [Thermomicrobium sp. 4228-Ro]
MSELQAWIASWLSVVASWLPFGYSFGAGMLAAVNPCGFAMLPAYLALFLGNNEESTTSGTARRLIRAAVVGTTVSLGFSTLFVLAGVMVSLGGTFLFPVMPWIGTAIGILLIVLGAAMFFGKVARPVLFEQLSDRLTRRSERSIPAFYLFGLAYGLASLSCTLPVFMIAAGSALVSGDVARGMLQLGSYSLGMASVIVTLTFALAFLRFGLVRAVRRAVPYVQTAAAALLIFAGLTIVLYWSAYR